MTDVKQFLKQNRPALREIAPLTFYGIIGFALFNLSLAASYPDILEKVPQLSSVAYIPIQVWVGIFGLYGILLLVSLAQNNWWRAKHFLIIGMVIKTAWLFQLITIAIQTNSRFVAFATIIWGLILYMKIFTYIYFTPRMGEGR